MMNDLLGLFAFVCLSDSFTAKVKFSKDCLVESMELEEDASMV